MSNLSYVVSLSVDEAAAVGGPERFFGHGKDAHSAFIDAGFKYRLRALALHREFQDACDLCEAKAEAEAEAKGLDTRARP